MNGTNEVNAVKSHQPAERSQLWHRAQALFESGDVTAAIACLQDSIFQEPENGHNYALLAECLVKCDRVEAAIEAAFQTVAFSIPHKCSQWFCDLHASIAARDRAARTALEIYEQSQHSDDRLRRITANFGRAAIAMRRGPLERASQWALAGLADISDEKANHNDERGLDYNALPISAVFDYVGQRCLEAQQYQLGSELYQAATRIQPGNGIFFRNLAAMLSGLGELKGSLDSEVRAHELRPEMYSEVDIEGLEIRLRDAKHDRYPDFAERVLERNPHQATIALQYGQLCVHAGYSQRGIQVLKQALLAFQSELLDDCEFARAYIERTAELADDAIDADSDRRIARWLQTLQVAPHSRDCYRDFVDILRLAKETKREGEQAQLVKTTREVPRAIGWHDTTADYARQATAAGHPVRYTAIDDELEVKLRDPKTLPGLEAELFASRSFRSTPLFVAELTEARLCWGGAVPANGKNVVAAVTHDRRMLADVSVRMPFPCVGFSYPHVRRHWLLNSERTPPLQHYEGTVANLASIAGRDGTANYYHWMVDLLPRVALIRDAGIDLNSIDLFLVDTYRSQFQRDSLAAMGVPLDRVASISDFPHIQATRTVLPSIPGKLATLSHYSIAALRRTIGQQFGTTFAAGKQATRRLYIRRDRARYRRIFNEAELVTRLERHGFTPIRPEEFSFAEQVKLFSEAEAIVAPHGAGLTNAVFCPPGTRIVELLAPGYIVPYYWILASQANLDYYYLTGEGMHGSHLRKLIYPNRIEEDVFIDLDRFDSLLDLAGLTR